MRFERHRNTPAGDQESHSVRHNGSHFASASIRTLSAATLFMASIAAFGFAVPREHSIEPSKDAVKASDGTTDAPPAVIDRAQRAGVLPIGFERNDGQTDPSVRFLAHGQGYSLFLTENQAVLQLVQEEQQNSDPLLRKLSPRKRKLVESRKSYRGSPRNRKMKKKTQTVRVTPVNASPAAKLEAVDELPGKSNYFVGNDPTKWRTGIPTFQRVRYSGVYPGVDLVYYGNQRQLEFDFVVAPKADPAAIALKVESAGRVGISKSGDLVITTADPSFRIRKPEVYQIVAGKRLPVAAKFVLREHREIGINVEHYDHSLPLIIDPTLAYSTYLGGNSVDDGFGVAVDASGDAYVVGQTTSTNFPTANAYSTTSNADGIAFVSKLDPTGTTLLYSTYLGGSGGECGNGIALDPNGNVYVTGYTLSTDFPIVKGFQTSIGTTEANAFVARIDTTQTGAASLVYSTYLGGGGNSANPIGDVGFAIAADVSGFAYITGQTTSDESVAPFPTTPGAFQTSLSSPYGNAFVAVVNTTSSGSNSLVYSTYLGGASSTFGDYGMAITVDSSEDAFVSGVTNSGSPTPFPTTPNAFQTSVTSSYGNAFVSEISTSQAGAASMIYSTLLGGSGNSSDDSGDIGQSIALDASGKVYVSGNTSSTDFPVTSGAYQTTNAANTAFVTKLDMSQAGAASLIYSTFLGGSNGDEGRGIAVDSSGNAYVAGTTASADFPTTSGAFDATLNSSYSDAFLTKLNSTGTALAYSSYLGGSCASGDSGNAIALDANSNPYIAGSTCSTDFPTYPSASYQSVLGGTQNAFVTKFALVANPSVSGSVSPLPNLSGWNNSAATVTFACLPGGAPISTCTSPITISSEGAGVVATGSAVDSAANSASTNISVNLDLTPPVLSIASPTSGTTVSTSSVAVSGSITDALSGVEGVTCNGVPATVTSSSFSCTVSLLSASNTITVQATDLAGNLSVATVNVSVSMATPTSLQVAPTTATIIVGSTQVFVATDQAGNRRPDATWSLSDSTVATLSSNGSGAVTGAAAGHTTLNATIGSVSAEADVTVVASTTVAPGTVLWTAPAVSGYTVQQIVQAVPTESGPAVYSIEADSSNDVLVRAFKANGMQLWQAAVTQFSTVPQGLGDNTGSLLLIAGSGIVNLNAQTGAQNWQYTPAPVSLVYPYLYGSPAVGADGSIYVIEQDCAASSTQSGTTPQVYTDTYTACLNQISGSDGTLTSQVSLPNSTYYYYVPEPCEGASTYTTYQPGALSSPIIGPDGAVYLEMDIAQYSNSATCDGEGQTYSVSSSVTTSLLKNGSQFQTLNSHSASGSLAASDTPGDVMPDGNGGLLAVFTDPTATGVTIVNTNGSRSTFADLSGFNSWALGDSGTAFITDGTNADAFNSTSVSENWSSSSTGGIRSLDNASGGGAVYLNDSNLGLVGLNSMGTAATPVSSLQGAQLYGYGEPIEGTQLTMWFGKNGGQLALLAGPSASLPSVYAGFEGDPQQQRSAVSVPRGLTVLSVITIPTSQIASCVTQNEPFGIYVGIHYQVNDQTGAPYKSNLMVPQERIVNLINSYGVRGDPFPEYGDMAPSRERRMSDGTLVGGGTFIQQTTKYSDANGQFWDIPFGFCANLDTSQTLTQHIRVVFEAEKRIFFVRTNNFYEASIEAGFGNISNYVDIFGSY